VEADAHAGTGVRRFQRHRQPGPGIPARMRPVPRLRSRSPAAAAEQLLEEVAEAPARAAAGEHLLEVEPAGPALPESPVWRPHLVARAVAARAQLVVRGP